MTELVIKVHHINMIEVNSNILKVPEMFTVDTIKTFLYKFIKNDKTVEKIRIYLAGRRHLHVLIDGSFVDIRQVSFTKPKLIQKNETKTNDFEGMKEMIKGFDALSKGLMNSIAK